MTLGLGLAVLSRSHTAAEAFNPDVVRCFAAPALTQSQPDAKQPAPHVADLRATAEPLTEQALSLARACTAARCDGDEAAELMRTVWRYLDARRRITSELYQRHRMAGLATADQVFDTPGTQALSQALGQLYAHGRLDPAQFGGNRDALALVISKPAEAFRPCTTAPTAANRNAFWYVY